MRYTSFAAISAFLMFYISAALAQTNPPANAPATAPAAAPAAAPATAPDAGAVSGTGGIESWWWVILVVIVVAAIIWYFMRGRATRV